MSDDCARRTAGISSPVVVLILSLGCGVDSPSAPTQTITPAPAAAPAPAAVRMRYQVSGIVTDDNGSRIANAEVAVRSVVRNDVIVRTSTDGGGHYTTAFEATTARVIGLIHTGGGEYEAYVQSLAGDRADIVKNLRPRRIRTIPAGQSLLVSIDPDSSIAYDADDWMNVDWVWEKFHIRVAEAGTLTIDARPQGGGTAPTLAVFCVYVIDNCRYEWVQPPMGTGRGSLAVKANSLFEIRLAIPSQMAPQRYEVTTSLQR